MITHLKLGNFKSWRELDIDLAPITLLFGTNSSGKSSILQALLMLKQTANSFDRGQHINFGGGERDYADLGSYRDLVFGHDETQPIILHFEHALTESLKDVSYMRQPNTSLSVWSYSIIWQKSDQQIIIRDLEYSKTFNQSGKNYRMERSEDETYVGTLSNGESRETIKGLSQPQSCYIIPYDEITLRLIGQVLIGKNSIVEYTWLLDFMSDFDDLMHRVTYLGPLRQHPQRAYLWTGSMPQTIGSKGENAIAALIASTREKGTDSSLWTQVALWLTNLKLVSGFYVKGIDSNQRFYEAGVSVEGINTSSSLIDVGFGVSQVLPVVTMLFFVPEGSIVLLEQPELHLHPSAQARLADLFLEVAEKRKLQLIVESHSEHLLRRMQRRIAEPEHAFATPDNIKAYFCEPTAEGSKATPVEVDEYGQIRNWPDNFFGDILGDLDAMTDAALARRREELSSGD